MPGAAYREFNFGLGESIDAVRDQARRFAQERIAPRANEIDRSNLFPRDLWRELGELGFLGLTVAPRTAAPVSAISRTPSPWRRYRGRRRPSV